MLKSPPISSNQHPELEVRRNLLTQMVANFRAQGFESEMNAEALSAQVADDNEQQREAREKAVADCKTKSDNAYRGAEALSAQLAKLPKPKKEKA